MRLTLFSIQNVKSSTLSSFYTSVVCERLAEDKAVDESFKKTLFLDATEGLSLKLSRSIPHNEYRMACLVVISSLVQRKGTGRCSTLIIACDQTIWLISFL